MIQITYQRVDSRKLIAVHLDNRFAGFIEQTSRIIGPSGHHMAKTRYTRWEGKINQTSFRALTLTEIKTKISTHFTGVEA